MVPRTAYPPIRDHNHLTHTLVPAEAQALLSTYLAATPSAPHLHPDSLLSTTGISYSAHSGPSGGLALHHLKRIEAGLRGEDLGRAEEDEELKRLKGEVEGDDEVLDGMIARTEARVGRKRKRTEQIREWAADASSSAGYDNEGEDGDGRVTKPGREIESFAHTPLHTAQYSQDREGEGGGEFDMENGDWQDQNEYELQQKMLEGELGERDGAPVQMQNLAGPPKIEREDAGGGARELTKEEKQARKKAKKARRMAEKAG